MKVDLPAELVTALAAQYPGCANTPSATSDLVTALLWQHVSLLAQTQQTLRPYLKTAA